MGEIKLEKDTLIVSETNDKGIIIYANEEFCKISGYSKDELIVKDNNIVRHPDMPKETSLELWNAIQAGEIWNGIVKNKTKNGDFYWLNATAYSSLDAKGNKRYISIRIKPTDREIKNAILLYGLSE